MTTSMRGIVYAIITAVLWGTLAIVLKVSLSDLTPADITWFRFLMAFSFLTGYYYFKKPAYLRILKRPPLTLVVATLCLALNYFGFIKGVQLTSPGVSQIFIQLGPVILAVSGFAFFHEKISARQAAGIVIALAGLVIFYRDQAHFFRGAGNHWYAGVVWVLVAAIAWAAYSIFLKILVLRFPPMQLNLIIFGLPALVYLPFVHVGHFMHLGFTGWAILLFLGFNTLIAYGLLALAIQYTEANKISMVLILNPVLTFVLMAVISHAGATWIKPEHLSGMTLAGAVIVLTGAFLTIFRRSDQSR